MFEKKLHDYSASWRILRPSSLTDQLFIKAKRIRSLEIKKESLVGEGIRPEFIGLINYGIVGLIQLDRGYSASRRLRTWVVRRSSRKGLMPTTWTSSTMPCLASLN